MRPQRAKEHREGTGGPETSAGAFRGSWRPPGWIWGWASIGLSSGGKVPEMSLTGRRRSRHDGWDSHSTLANPTHQRIRCVSGDPRVPVRSLWGVGKEWGAIWWCARRWPRWQGHQDGGERVSPWDLGPPGARWRWFGATWDARGRKLLDYISFLYFGIK